MVTGIIPSPPKILPSIFIAHRVLQQSHYSTTFHRRLLTHALAFSANQFVRKEIYPRIYTRMHSAGFELMKLTYTRLEENLIRHRGELLIIFILYWNLIRSIYQFPSLDISWIRGQYESSVFLPLPVSLHPIVLQDDFRPFFPRPLASNCASPRCQPLPAVKLLVSSTLHFSS